MDSIVESSGSTVHILSGIKFSTSTPAKGLTKVDSFFALQLGPVEPFHCEFILSNVIAFSPDFKFETAVNNHHCNLKRFMLITFDIWRTEEEAVNIALLCQQEGADGVIISLSSSTTYKKIAYGPEELIAEEAKSWSRFTFSRCFELLKIPVLALMSNAINYLKESHNKTSYFTVTVGNNSLVRSFRGAKDFIVDDLIGNGPLDSSKLAYIRHLLETKYSAYNFNSENTPQCYRRLEELSNEDTFPIGMEIEIQISSMVSLSLPEVWISSKETKQFSYDVCAKYFESGKWTMQSVDNARNYASLFLERLKIDLENFSKGSLMESFRSGSYTKNLGPSILYLVFLHETNYISPIYFNRQWERIIRFYIESSSYKKEVIGHFQYMFNCLNQRSHILPPTFVLWELVDLINDVELAESYFPIFRYFEDPIQEESLLQSFVETLSFKCNTWENLIELFDRIGQMDNTVRSCILKLLDPVIFRILHNFDVNKVKAWLQSQYYHSYKLPGHPDTIRNLLEFFDPTRFSDPTAETIIYFELIKIVEESPYLVHIADILERKLLHILSRQGWLALFKVLLGENKFPVIIKNFDKIEKVLKMSITLGPPPEMEPFQSFAQYLAAIN